jgi:type IV secretion system protein VirD4
VLQAIRRGTYHEFRDAVLLSDMLMNPEKRQFSGSEVHWQGTAMGMGACSMMYEVHKNPRASLSSLAQFWSNPYRTPEQNLRYIAETAPTQAIASLAGEGLQRPDKEVGSILSTMMRQLLVFRDPTLAANTAHSDFRLEDFTRHDALTSLYIVLSPGEEEYLRPFLRMFLRLALQRWLEMGDTKHAIALVLDEFTSWGHMQFFVENLSVIGGRGIRALLAVQNTPQLRDTYGHTDTILEQCKVRVFFAAQGPTTGQEIAKQLGTATATTRQKSTRNDAGFFGGTTIQEQAHARGLLTEGEAEEIPDTHEVIRVAGKPPIWAEKIRYWEWPQWQAKAVLAVPGGTP